VNSEKSISPTVTAGVLIGLGVGGLVEALLFRRILGAHQFLAGEGAQAAQKSATADNIFLAVCTVLVLAGMAFLFASRKRTDVLYSGQIVFGGVCVGLGGYALLEGILFHHVLKAHHLLAKANPASMETADYAYLICGVLLAVLGYWAVQATQKEFEEKARDASRSTQRAKEAKGDRKVYLD